MKSVHTHRGHCQACGRVQAVDNDRTLIAKHGYSVERGYFHGVCAGSDHKPLELERSLTDTHAAGCDATAQRHETHLANLHAGKAFPTNVQKYRDGGMFAGRPAHYPHAEHDIVQGKAIPRKIPWLKASACEKQRGMADHIAETEHAAAFFRNHAKTLRELAKRVHGQPLRPAESKPVLEIGDLVTLAAWGLSKSPVLALRKSPKSFGGGTEAQFKRAKDGLVFWVPLRSIRASFTKASK